MGLDYSVVRQELIDVCCFGADNLSEIIKERQVVWTVLRNPPQALAIG
jgi:hypothetical protein